eukprot:tig00001416_g8960.t1
MRMRAERELELLLLTTKKGELLQVRRTSQRQRLQSCFKFVAPANANACILTVAAGLTSTAFSLAKRSLIFGVLCRVRSMSTLGGPLWGGRDGVDLQLISQPLPKGGVAVGCLGAASGAAWQVAALAPAMSLRLRRARAREEYTSLASSAHPRRRRRASYTLSLVRGIRALNRVSWRRPAGPAQAPLSQ